jgi:hypothetical protein
MIIEWKVIELRADEEVIKSAKYFVRATHEGNKVETEGYCYFNGNSGIPLAEVTEEKVIEWIQEITSESGVCIVSERLKEQLDYLEKQSTVELPWKTKTFKLSI